jgi:hypothetical protein
MFDRHSGGKMKISFFGRALMAPVLLAGLFTSVTAFGATIDLNALLANQFFTLGNQVSGCPNGWTCAGSPSPGFTSYVTTSAQYPGSPLVPNGSHVASTPTTIEGSGFLNQNNLGITWMANMTYTLTFYAGRPLTEIDGTTAVVGFEPSSFFQLLANGVANTLPATAITDPGAGQWAKYMISFTTPGSAAYLGQTVGLSFENLGTQGLGNNLSDNIAFVAVPEPTSLLLGGLGIVGLGLLRRRRAA